MTISFDPAKYAGVRATTDGVLRWDAPPVKFRVRGPARTDATEILGVIAQKASLKWLQEDLHGERSDRRDTVWRAIYEYGDSRLRPFLERFEKDEPEKRYHFYRPEHLRPFEEQRLSRRR